MSGFNPGEKMKLRRALIVRVVVAVMQGYPWLLLSFSSRYILFEEFL